MVDDLICGLGEFKANMGCCNVDFNVDKTMQYEAAKNVMVRKHFSEDVDLFGPEETTAIPCSGASEKRVGKSQVRESVDQEGYYRVL